MNYPEFKNKYLGKPIDWDGKYGSQCVDVYRQYCNELGFKQSPPVVGAKDIWDTYLQTDWDRIVNTTEAIPEQGDVIIWGTKVGQYGHVAIFDSANKTSFISIDQNWPVDNGTGVLHEVKHTYTGVLGWLRCKIKPVSDLDNMTEQEKLMLDFIRVNQMTEGQLREGFGYVKEGTVEKLSKEIEALKQSQSDLNNRLADLELKLASNEKSLSDYQSQLKTANKTNQSLVADIEYYKPYKALYENKLKETVDKLSFKELLVELKNRIFKSLGKK